MTKVATTLRSCYLAGPMRGHAELNFPAFHKATAWLRKENWTVFSPAERDESDPVLNGDWAITGTRGLDYYMQYDLAAVAQTDCVICLPGWETSQGARLETMVAVELGHPVFEIVQKKAGPFLLGQPNIESVDNARVAAEFIAGTRAYDGLPTVSRWDELVS